MFVVPKKLVGTHRRVKDKLWKKKLIKMKELKKGSEQTMIASGSKPAENNNREWVCSQCTFINTVMVDRCKMCLKEHEAIQFIQDDQDSITSANKNQYDELLELENVAIIRNINKFQCITCFDEIDVGKGIKLHECLHEFCEDCLARLIKASDKTPIICPFSENDIICEGTIQHREIKYLVNETVFEHILYRSLLQGQKDLKNCFQCKTPDCRGMWEYDDNVHNYQCPLCRQVNCHQCNAAHGIISCRAYQETVYDETNPEALETRQMYEEMFANGKALRCPQCKIVIVRDEGCSWVVCALCKTEICWATRGPRWGPQGNGDTTGGCRCDFKKGKPCHPNCAYCH